MDPAALKRSSDKELAALSAHGSIQAWHEFVLQYSGIIRAVIRRYLTWMDDEDQMNAYVDILEYMFSEGLSRYDGRACLSTWITTVTRNRCLDLLRSKAGRRRPPKWLEGFSEVERHVYRLFYLEFRSPPAILAWLAGHGHLLTPQMLDDILHRIDDRMDRSFRRRMAYDLQAGSLGVLSGRMLEFMDHLRLEQEQNLASAPDVELFRKRTLELLEEIRRHVAVLDNPERRVIELRFFENMKAPRIARLLNLAGSHSVHAVIDRALLTLRNMIEPKPGVRTFRAESSMPAEDRQ
jgi:RNA polymerase sigma factor (sigma-70 family)